MSYWVFQLQKLVLRTQGSLKMVARILGRTVWKPQYQNSLLRSGDATEQSKERAMLSAILGNLLVLKEQRLPNNGQFLSKCSFSADFECYI